MRSITVALLAATAADAVLLTPALSPRSLSHLRMSAAESSAPEPLRKVKVELLAQRRAAVSGMAPGEEASTFATVEEVKQDVSVMGRAKGPLSAVTLAATVSLLGWQTNKLYQVRQSRLLAEFTATVMVCLGDVSALKNTMKDFRTQLGPGPFRAKMLAEALTALATEKPIGAETIQQLKQLLGVMKVKRKELPEVLIKCSTKLQKSPSVLNKLVFLSERAMPQAATEAQLRTRFPTWSEETVGALQDAMLENLYKEQCEAQPDGAPAPAGYDVLGMSEAQAMQMMQEVVQERARKAAELAAERAAEAEAAAVEAKLREKVAAETKEEPPAPTAVDEDIFSSPDEKKDDDPEVGRADESHEFECSDCGYILFPAAGREGKFFGDDFSCPNCGASKDKFVDKSI